MNRQFDAAVEEYGAALRDHLTGGGEAALHRAYQIGRQALDDGAGVLFMIAIHSQALSTILSEATVQRIDIAKANEFLAESLAPFEMAERGFQHAIAQLQAANQQLTRQAGELQAANGDLEAFSYSVSHDLRAPLRAINGFSGLLLNNCGNELSAKAQHYLKRVCDNATRMGEMIEGLLTFARFARADVRRARVDLTALTRTILSDLEQSAGDRHVTVVIATDVICVGDPVLLRAALENLLGNAWKYTSKTEDARIEFGATAYHDQVAYFVRDNGVGFDPAYAARLFQPFQRLHTQTEFEGIGIGLSTVRRIIQRHGGRIWAEAALGDGATFYFTLPEREGGSDTPSAERGSRDEPDHPKPT